MPEYIKEGTKRHNRRRFMPKGLFFDGKGKIYIASVTKNGRASGFRTDITTKAIDLVAKYLARKSEIAGTEVGVKTPYGILRLDPLGE
jgi:hypothetical protein